MLYHRAISFDCITANSAKGDKEMIVGTHMTKESLLYNRVVYIAIPKRLFKDAICERAIKYVKTLKPLAIIDPRDTFSSNEEWLKEFPRYLKTCDAIVVVTDNGFIGKGVHDELRFFVDHGFPCYHYLERGKHQNIIDIGGVRVVDYNNWIDYAMIEYAH